MDRQTLIAELSRDEGRRLMPYTDTVGKITIGVGRNLTDVGISESECDMLLADDIDRTITWLDAKLPWWRELDTVRQRAMVNMAFNMGGGLLTFVNTLDAIKRGDYAAASKGMLDSKWARQVGARATRLAEMMTTGKS
ncbi:glycoside hydrolase family protein [Burkholderia plantarii]|uniref:glycoside hydrolase family protein n=1 Tax=Burkholderia plantarii TaxID=41899 RepID=UPI0006D8AD2A|nr:glycoside hydrolase family protein [Burkholderia plantarii]